MYQSRVVPAKQNISPVTIALQQLSGERLIGEFSPEGSFVRNCHEFVVWANYVLFLTVTLWDILQHWEAENKLEPALSSLTSQIPVCIYLRNTISSKEALQATTLLILGIANGRAAIR